MCNAEIVLVPVSNTNRKTAILFEKLLLVKVYWNNTNNYCETEVVGMST